MISEKLIDSIKLHEGFRSTYYRCTPNVLTIGYGRAIDPDLEGAGITEAEAEMMLENDFVCFQRAAMLELAFNMGQGNPVKLMNVLAALANEDFEPAKSEALASRWATQVTKRAYRIAERIRTGVYA